MNSNIMKIDKFGSSYDDSSFESDKTKLSIKPWKWRYIIKLNIELHSFSFFLFFYFNFLNFFYDFAVMEFLTRNTSGVWSAQHKTTLRQWSISGRISEKPNFIKNDTIMLHKNQTIRAFYQTSPGARCLLR